MEVNPLQQDRWSEVINIFHSPVNLNAHHMKHFYIWMSLYD